MNCQDSNEMIADNLARVRKCIDQAAARTGRDPAGITLVAVSKRHPISMIDQAMAAGQIHFGENFLQEAREKICHTGSGPIWHFIGHLQSNKARDAALLFQMVETVDRKEIAFKLEKHLQALDRSLSVLVQVNIGCEPQKKGVHPEQLEQLLRDLRVLARVQVRGLMTLPPWNDDPEQTRPFFRQMKALADTMSEKQLFSPGNPVELSMGMSHDFETAIEEGATIIRVGTAIFGTRTS